MRRILAGATVVDGSGGPGEARDVYIEGERIARVTAPADQHPDGWQVEDWGGATVVPGFIDVHSHADGSAFLMDADTSKILQGVTTEVVGNCGFSMAPRTSEGAADLAALWSALGPVPAWDGERFKEYWTTAAEAGLVTNQAALVGHNALRLAVMGLADRAPSPGELMRMGDLLEAALAEGAWGLSTGLIYPPGLFSDTEEIIALARRLGGRHYVSHMRNEGSQLNRAVHEALTIGQEADVPVQISHLKSSGLANWGGVQKVLELIDQAREAGTTVYQDVYPYTASSTMLRACLPPWMQAGGAEATLARLQDPEALVRLRRDLEHGLPGWENSCQATGYDRIVVASTHDHRYEGQSLADIARDLHTDGAQALIQVLVDERLRASMLLHSMAEEDLTAALRHPGTMIGSDGLPAGAGGKPHPRLYGTFPRVLSRYVREIPVLSFERAIHKMTGLPANVFGLTDRGTIAEGNMADLVILDPAQVKDGATFEDPTEPPIGIRAVYLAGEPVVRDNRYQGERQGQWLRHPGTSTNTPVRNP